MATISVFFSVHRLKWRFGEDAAAGMGFKFLIRVRASPEALHPLTKFDQRAFMTFDSHNLQKAPRQNTIACRAYFASRKSLAFRL